MRTGSRVAACGLSRRPLFVCVAFAGSFLVHPPHRVSPMAEPTARSPTLGEVMDRPFTPRGTRRWSWASLKQRALSAAIGGSSGDAEEWSLDELPANFFELEARDAKGAAHALEQYRGSVVLVCNVASF